MKLKSLLLLITLALLWGPSFLFIKIAVEEIPPFTMVVGRIGIGAIVLSVILWLKNGRLPTDPKIWKHLAFMAMVHNAIPFVLFAYGEQFIDSTLASIMNGTVPLFAIILAHFYIETDRLTSKKLIGALVGFGGLIVLSSPSLGDGVRSTSLGILAIAAASVLYGIAMVYARKNLRGLPPLVAPTGQMILATIVLLPLSLIVERPFQLPPPSLVSWGAIAFLGVLGTGVAFIVFYQLQEIADPSYVSMVTYLIPIVGVVLGVVVLNEQLSWHSYVGCGLILFSVMVINNVFQRREQILPAASPSD